MGAKRSLFRYTLHPHTPKDVNKIHDEQLTFGQKIADNLAGELGSWTFIIAQSIVMGFWILLNTLTAFHFIRFDSYPFVFLNLAMSAEAAFSAPIIMMAQNRQAQKDRLMVENDYLTDVANREHIEQMIRHLDSQDAELLRQTEMILKILEKMKKQTGQLPLD